MWKRACKMPFNFDMKKENETVNIQEKTEKQGGKCTIVKRKPWSRHSERDGEKIEKKKIRCWQTIDVKRSEQTTCVFFLIFFSFVDYAAFNKWFHSIL